MDISEEVLDGIRELVTIGVGHSAGILNELTKAHVTLTVPEIQIFEPISDGFLNFPDLGMKPEDRSQVFLSFSGECTGSLSLIIPNISAINLVILLTGENGSPDEMDALRVETLLEVGNVIISSVMSSFSILLSSHLSFLFPSYQSGSGKMASYPFNSKPDIGVLARTRFQVQHKEIEGVLLFLLTRASYMRFEESIHRLMERGL